MRLQRIARELREIEEGADADGLFAFQNPSNWGHVIAVVKGPADSPYAGGYYQLDIDFPNDYPFKTCIIQFDTKVWHPNIFHDTGAICSALLYEDWSPVYTLQKCLVVLQNLLHAPVVTEPSQAANTEAATSLVNNFETFDKKARFWNEAYALAAPPTAEEVAQWFATQPRVSQATRFPSRGIPAHLLQASPLLGQRTITDNRIFGSSARSFGGASSSVLTSWILETADDNARRRQRKYPNHQPELAPVSEITRLPQASAMSQNTSGSPLAPPSWLALLLEGRTTPAFISLCEEKLIQQEDFSSAELLAMVPESEFNNDYLTSIGITAKGLQIKLVNLHKELRETHRETSLVTSPMLSAQDEDSNNHPHSPEIVEVTDGAIKIPVVALPPPAAVTANPPETKFCPNLTVVEMMRGRIARELEEIENNNTDGLFAYQDPMNWSHVIAVVKGPVDSPYQGRYFKLDVEYPHDYPFKALKIKFCTEVWHPHVNPETGVFDSSSLYTNWTPACALLNCLIVAQSMLHAPVIIEPADATNPEAAISFVADLAIFEQKARFWTEAYAMAAPPSEEEVTQWFAAAQASVKPLTPPTPPCPAPTISTPNDSLPASALLLPVEFTGGKQYGGQRRTIPKKPIVSIPSPPSDAQLGVEIMNARRRLLAKDAAVEEQPIPSISGRRICCEKEASEVTVPQGKTLSTSPPVPPSWLALQLEGHTSPAFIALSERKLIQGEGFNSAKLLSMVPEGEFTCDYLSSIGITARGLKISLMIMHRELRSKYKVADDIAEDVVAAANARIAALETENANLKAQLEDKQDKQTRTVSFAESVESDDGFVQVDLV